MGELSKRDAEDVRNDYIQILESNRDKVRQDFDEMDFKNADQRKIMETHIQDIEIEYNTLITRLSNMVFE